MGVGARHSGTVWFECEISPTVLHVCRLDPQMVALFGRLRSLEVELCWRKWLWEMGLRFYSLATLTVLCLPIAMPSLLWWTESPLEWRQSKPRLPRLLL